MVSPPLVAQTIAANPKDGSPFQLDYGIHDGTFRNLAGPVFTDQIRFAHEQGFRAIEDNGMMDRPAEEQARIGDTLRQLGMTMGVFVLNFDHWPVSTSARASGSRWCRATTTGNWLWGTRRRMSSMHYARLAKYSNPTGSLWYWKR